MSSVYADASIGNSINIAVVEMMSIGTVVQPDNYGHIPGGFAFGLRDTVHINHISSPT